MNVNSTAPIAPAVQQPVISQEAQERAKNAFPKAQQVAQPAPRPEAPDQSKQKANLEAAGWRASQHAIATTAAPFLDHSVQKFLQLGHGVFAEHANRRAAGLGDAH